MHFEAWAFAGMGSGTLAPRIRTKWNGKWKKMVSMLSLKSRPVDTEHSLYHAGLLILLFVVSPPFLVNRQPLDNTILKLRHNGVDRHLMHMQGVL